MTRSRFKGFPRAVLDEDVPWSLSPVDGAPLLGTRGNVRGGPCLVKPHGVRFPTTAAPGARPIGPGAAIGQIAASSLLEALRAPHGP